MNKHKYSTRNHKRIAVLLIVGTLAVIAAFLYFSFFSQISQVQAQKACEGFFKDVRTNITSVPGYKIVAEHTSPCSGSQDEAGSTDYNFSVHYLVSKVPVSSSSSLRGDITNFVSKLPHNDYGISAENAPPKNGRPPMLCVSASRYLDNDGRYIQQGSNSDNQGTYIEQSEFSGGYDSGCSDF